MLICADIAYSSRKFKKYIYTQCNSSYEGKCHILEINKIELRYMYNLQFAKFYNGLQSNLGRVVFAFLASRELMS